MQITARIGPIPFPRIVTQSRNNVLNFIIKVFALKKKSKTKQKQIIAMIICLK